VSSDPATDAVPDPAPEPDPVPEPVPDRVPDPVPDRVRRVPPDVTADDTDEGWGERPESNDRRLLEERPPHWE
jgi:hypothetical protein